MAWRKEDPDKVTGAFFLSGFDIAKQFGYQRLGGLTFNKWISGNEFEMEDNKTQFAIESGAKKTLSITKIKRK